MAHGCVRLGYDYRRATRSCRWVPVTIGWGLGVRLRRVFGTDNSEQNYSPANEPRAPIGTGWAPKASVRKLRHFSGTASGLGSLVTLITTLLMAGCERPPITANGVIKVFGTVGLGPGAFSYPRAITADPDGSILVVDKAGRVQRFSDDGAYLAEWRMPETVRGKPVGLTVHPDGRVFVADTHYHRVLVFNRSGDLIDSFGREGTGDDSSLSKRTACLRAAPFVREDHFGNAQFSRYEKRATVTRLPSKTSSLRSSISMASCGPPVTIFFMQAGSRKLKVTSADGASPPPVVIRPPSMTT